MSKAYTNQQAPDCKPTPLTPLPCDDSDWVVKFFNVAGIDKHCTRCGAKPYESCVDRSGKARKVLHAVRVRGPRKIEKVGPKIYIIGKEFGPPVKVGISDNVSKRLKQLQTGSPERLVIHYVFRCKTRRLAVLAESTFESLNRGKVRHGEWYNMDPMTAISLVEETLDCIKPPQ